MRDNVLGLEAVLADGQVWDGLRALRKDSSGYDLKQLFIRRGGHPRGGDSGRSAPAPGHAPHPERPGRDIRARQPDAVAGTGLSPLRHDVTAFELVPEVGLAKVCEKLGLSRPLQARADFYVLLRLGSAEPVSERLGAFLAEASERGWVTDAAVAVTEEHAERLWTIRDELSPMFLWAQHEHGLKFDNAVPIDRLGPYHDEVRRIAAELAPAALTYGFGHVGDGNIHLYVLPTSDDQVAPFLAVRDELQERIDEATFRFGGTLSAEHGIGQLLRARIRHQKPAAEWELMRAVKDALDPHGIMNPQKTLPAGP